MKISQYRGRVGCALVVVLCMAQVGCATDDYYSPVVRHSPPSRWPDPVPVCTTVGRLISQLHIAVNGVYIPERQDLSCRPLNAEPEFRDGDDAYIGEGKIDPSGYASYAMSTYRLTIDNPAARQRKAGLNGEDVNPVLNESAGVSPTGYGVRFWRHHEQIFFREERINGLSWRHYAFTRYDSSSEDPSVMGHFATEGSVDIAEPVNNAPAVTDIVEVYVHDIDEGHAVIAKGRYERLVIEDPAWYASRKELLERMVRSIGLRDVSDAEVERARDADNARKAERLNARKKKS